MVLLFRRLYELRAEEAARGGVPVVVVGPPGAGKTTFIKILRGRGVEAAEETAGLAPGGAVVQLSKFALYVSKVGDPILQIALTTYNAATAFVMVFHFLDFMAGAAVKMAMPLLALSLLAVIFDPTRALGGALLFFALITIVPSYIGYYLAPLGKEFAAWGVETAKWLNATAANATGIAPVPLLAVEGDPHTLFLARYNNTFVKPNAAELGEKMREVLNLTDVPLNSTHVLRVEE